MDEDEKQRIREEKDFRESICRAKKWAIIFSFFFVVLALIGFSSGEEIFDGLVALSGLIIVGIGGCLAILESKIVRLHNKLVKADVIEEDLLDGGD